MKHTKPFSQFEIPRMHLPAEPTHRHYKPAPALEKTEIERRKKLPYGTLLAEQQHHSIQVARQVLEVVGQTGSLTSLEKASDQIAAALFNSTFYLDAGRAVGVMRRVYELKHNESRPLPAIQTDFVDEAVESLTVAEVISERLVISRAKKHACTPVYEKRLAHQFANAFMSLSCVAVAEDFNDLFDDDSRDLSAIQNLTREACLVTEARSKTLDGRVVYPSIAQLADKASPEAEYWMEQGTGIMRTALHTTLN